MLERFAQAARQAVDGARQEAVQAGQHEVRGEHLLVALAVQPGTAADALTAAGLDAAALRARLPRGDDPPAALDADALATLGIDLDAVRRAADAAFGPGALERTGPGPRGRMPFTADAKQCLAGATRSAALGRSRAISSGHLLIGVLDHQGSGAALLSRAGTDFAALRADVARRMAAAA